MKIQHKKSAIADAGVAKRPTAAATEYGELCINYNHEDPSLFIRVNDKGTNADSIVKVGGDLDLYLLKSELGATVILGENPPVFKPNGDQIAAGDLWYCSSTVAEGGGRLYVYYVDDDTSQWVDTSLPGGGTAGSEDLFLSKTEDDTAAGAITFEGQTTHEGGIQVSGATAGNNIYGGARSSLGVVGAEGSGAIFGFVSAGGETKYDILGQPGAGLFDNHYSFYGALPTASTTSTLFAVACTQDTGADNVYGFRTLGGFWDNQSGNAHGIYLDVPPSGTVGKKNYNLYITGDGDGAGPKAQNYIGTDINFGDWRQVGTGAPGIGNSSTGIKFRASDNVLAISTGSAANSGRCLHLSRNTEGMVAQFGFNGTGTVGAITINSTSTNYGESSDYRLKENIQQMDSAVDKVKALNLVKYNFIAEPNVTIDGFLAHELQEIVPQAVTGTKDATRSTGEIEPQMVDKSKLIPLLTKALQETIAKNEDLEARIAALEGA